MQYDLNLTANGAQQIDVAGTYFKYASGTGPIRVQVNGGGYVDLLPGQGMQGLKFTRLMVKDTSGATNIGALVAGEGQFIDARISGTVDVVDGGKSRTKANMAFVASGSITSDATTAPAIYLLNPAGSGKNIIVKTLNISFDQTQAYGLCAVLGVTGSDSSAAGIVSKSLAGTFMAKIFRHYTGGKAAPLLSSYVTATLSANQIDKNVFQEPIVLKAGQVLMAFGTLVSSTIYATLECIEEPA